MPRRTASSRRRHAPSAHAPALAGGWGWCGHGMWHFLSLVVTVWHGMGHDMNGME